MHHIDNVAESSPYNAVSQEIQHLPVSDANLPPSATHLDV